LTQHGEIKEEEEKKSATFELHISDPCARRSCYNQHSYKNNTPLCWKKLLQPPQL